MYSGFVCKYTIYSHNRQNVLKKNVYFEYVNGIISNLVQVKEFFDTVTYHKIKDFYYICKRKQSNRKTMTTKEIGDLGEDTATKYLVSQGYVILDRNWRCGHLELDIVALDGIFLAFIEVKTRKDNSILSPQDSINKTKQRLLINAANGYIRKYRRHEEARFDVVCITHHNGTVTDIELTKNAFYPSLRTR